MIINNIEEMRNFAKKFAPLLKEGDVISLEGDLGAGKTALVTFIGEYFNIKDVSSPSFALVNIYEGDKKIYHLDLYRFEDEDEILDLDYDNYFYPEDGLTFLEWAKNVASYLPDGMIKLKINKLEDDKRELVFYKDNKREEEIYENFSN